MIGYEIQLQYVIRDKIQSETNSVQDKIWSKTKFRLRQNLSIFFYFGKKIFVRKEISQILSQTKILSRTEFWLGSPVHFF